LSDLLEEEGSLASMIQGIGVFPAILAALILGTDRRIIQKLRAAHATSSGTAIPLDNSSALKHWRLERLIRKGAVQTTDANRYYINEIAWRVYQHQRRKRGVTIILILVPLMLLLWWTSSAAAEVPWRSA
jgi:hypothetical protein